MSRLLRLCSCCRRWVDWHTAKLIGVQAGEGGERLEMRNCPRCSSTLCRTVAGPDVEADRASQAWREWGTDETDVELRPFDAEAAD